MTKKLLKFFKLLFCTNAVSGSHQIFAVHNSCPSQKTIPNTCISYLEVFSREDSYFRLIIIYHFINLHLIVFVIRTILDISHLNIILQIRSLYLQWQSEPRSQIVRVMWKYQTEDRIETEKVSCRIFSEVVLFSFDHILPYKRRFYSKVQICFELSFRTCCFRTLVTVKFSDAKKFIESFSLTFIWTFILLGTKVSEQMKVAKA